MTEYRRWQHITWSLWITHSGKLLCWKRCISIFLTKIWLSSPELDKLSAYTLSYYFLLSVRWTRVVDHKSQRKTDKSANLRGEADRLWKGLTLILMNLPAPEKHLIPVVMWTRGSWIYAAVPQRACCSCRSTEDNPAGAMQKKWGMDPMLG